jgi:hypothetical protein
MLGISTTNIRVGGFRKGKGFDADAVAFFGRVTAAGGTLSATEMMATNKLVLDMKSAGIWTSMKAVYPMVGASASACAQNLKSSSFTGTFNGGWTYASTGVTPNGTNGYMNTSLNPFSALTNNNYHLSHYSRTQKITAPEVDLGVVSPSPVMISLSQYYQGAGKAFVAGDYNNSVITNLAAVNTLGFQINTRTSQTSAKMFFNNTQIGSTLTLSNPNNLPNNNLLLGSSFNGVAVEFSSKQCAFASIGDGLNDTNVSNLYTAVLSFQTNLSRNV